MSYVVRVLARLKSQAAHYLKVWIENNHVPVLGLRERTCRGCARDRRRSPSGREGTTCRSAPKSPECKRTSPTRPPSSERRERPRTHERWRGGCTGHGRDARNRHRGARQLRRRPLEPMPALFHLPYQTSLTAPLSFSRPQPRPSNFILSLSIQCGSRFFLSFATDTILLFSFVSFYYSFAANGRLGHTLYLLSVVHSVIGLS